MALPDDLAEDMRDGAEHLFAQMIKSALHLVFAMSSTDVEANHFCVVGKDGAHVRVTVELAPTEEDHE